MKHIHFVDWSTRRGVVVRSKRFTHTVHVIWDGRQSVDEWPASALEKA